MKIRLWFTLFSTVVFLGMGLVSMAAAQEPAAPPTVTCDIDACLKLAVQRNPGIRRQEALTHSLEYGVVSAAAIYRPKLTLDASVDKVLRSFRTPDLTILGAQVAPIESQKSNFYTARLEFSVPLVREGRPVLMTLPSEAGAKDALAAQKAAANEVRADVLYEVISSFYAAQKASREVAIAEEKLRTSSAHLKVAKEKFRLNLISKADLLQAEARELSSRSDVIEAQNAAQSTVAELARQIGLELTEKISLLPPGGASFPAPPSLETLVQEAEAHHPEIQAELARLRSSEDALRLAKSQYFPTLTALTRYTIADDFNYPIDAEDWRVAIGLSWLLYDFGARSATVKEADYAMQARSMSVISVRQAISQGVVQSYLGLANIDGQLPYLRKNLEQAREALRVAQGKYAQNLISQSSLFDVQDKTADAEKAVIRTEYQRQVQYTALLRAAGETPAP